MDYKCEWRRIVDSDLEKKLLGNDAVTLGNLMPDHIDCFSCDGYDTQCPYYSCVDHEEYLIVQKRKLLGDYKKS